MSWEGLSLEIGTTSHQESIVQTMRRVPSNILLPGATMGSSQLRVVFTGNSVEQRVVVSTWDWDLG